MAFRSDLEAAHAQTESLQAELFEAKEKLANRPTKTEVKIVKEPSSYERFLTPIAGLICIAAFAFGIPTGMSIAGCWSSEDPLSEPLTGERVPIDLGGSEIIQRGGFDRLVFSVDTPSVVHISVESPAGEPWSKVGIFLRSGSSFNRIIDANEGYLFREIQPGRYSISIGAGGSEPLARVRIRAFREVTE